MGIYTKKWNSTGKKDLCSVMLITALFIGKKKMKSPKIKDRIKDVIM